MAPGLQLSQRLTQSLVLAPQLQQSLALLQAPTLELKALVEHELQQNPVLEEVAAPDGELNEKASSEEDTSMIHSPDEHASDTSTEKSADGTVDDFQAEFDKLLQLDQEWREHFSQTNIPSKQNPEEEEKRQFMFDSLTADTSLAEALMEQVRESDLTDAQREIAELIVGNIDDHGYLKSSVE